MPIYDPLNGSMTNSEKLDADDLYYAKQRHEEFIANEFPKEKKESTDCPNCIAIDREVRYRRCEDVIHCQGQYLDQGKEQLRDSEGEK